MARFPTNLGNIGVPRTQLQTFSVNPPAEAFGAGVARALAGFGADIGQLSDQMKERENQKNRYNALIDLTRFSDRSARALEELKREAPPGAPGFTNSVEASLRQQANDYIGTLPPDLQDEFRMRVEPIVGSRVNDAFAFQLASEDTKFKADYTLEESKSFGVVHENPEAADAEAERLMELVLESPLPEQEKEALVTQTVRVLREGQFLGELERGYTTGTFEAPVAWTEAPPVAQGFLAAVAGPESNGRYNVRFDGSPTGASFHDFSDHPAVPAPIPAGFKAAGQVSTAAGKYQITKTTWDEFAPKAGVTDFSPASQDKVAWEIAKRRYKGDLEKDLRENPGKVRRALSGTWEGLGNLSDEEFAAAVQDREVLAGVGPLPDAFNDPRFAVLTPDDKLRLAKKAKAEGEARRREAQRTFLQGETGTAWKDEMQFRRTQGREPDGSIYTNEAIISMFAPDEAALLIAERDRALDDGRLFTSVASATPEEVLGVMQDAVDALNDPENFTMNEERFNRLQTMVNDRNEKLRKDAPSYIAQTNTQVAELLEGVQDEDSAAAYAEAVLEEQARLGVPRENQRVMSKDWASDTVRGINELEPDARGQAINELVGRWGDHSQQVLLDLEDAGLAPGLYYAGVFSDQPGLSHEIAAAVANDKEIKASVPSDILDDIDDAVASAFEPFSNAFGAGDWTGQSVERLNELRSVASSVVRLRVSNGEDLNEAANRLAEEMIDENYDLVEDSRVRAYIPKQVGDLAIDAAKVQDVADALLRPEFVESIGLEAFGVEGDPEVDLEVTRRAIADTGFWVTNSDADGLQLMVPFGPEARMTLPVRDAQGRTIELSFERMMNTHTDPEAQPLEIFRVIEDLFGRVIGG